MSPEPYKGDPITWKVVQQVDATGPDINGAYVEGKKISYQLSNGVTGSVFVPSTSYTAANVMRAIQQKAAEELAVSALQGKVGG